MFPKKWVKHEWGECVYYRSILRRYCWNGFAVDILRQVNLCMLQSGYYPAWCSAPSAERFTASKNARQTGQAR